MTVAVCLSRWVGAWTDHAIAPPVHLVHPAHPAALQHVWNRPITQKYQETSRGQPRRDRHPVRLICATRLWPQKYTRCQRERGRPRRHPRVPFTLLTLCRARFPAVERPLFLLVAGSVVPRPSNFQMVGNAVGHFAHSVATRVQRRTPKKSKGSKKERRVQQGKECRAPHPPPSLPARRPTTPSSCPDPNC